MHLSRTPSCPHLLLLLSLSTHSTRTAHKKLLPLHSTLCVYPLQEGCTVLYRAANFGQADMVHELLMSEAMDVNAATADGCTPLFIAVNYGYADVVQQLLTHKLLDVNQPHVNGCTPLFRAAASGQSEVMSALLAHEAVAVRLVTVLVTHWPLRALFEST